MKTVVTSQQISHFALFGWIEFEQFLTPDEVASIRSAALSTLAKRLKTDLKKLSRFDLYLQGRDIWRDDSFLKHFFCKERFSSTVCTLTKNQSIILACDQWIPSKKNFDPLHLEDHLSFQNLICGCLLILDGAKEGFARFFSPDRFSIVDETQMLIAFGSPRTVYIRNPKDPSNSLLKNYGYSFGDHLHSERNPLCHRSSF